MDIIEETKSNAEKRRELRRSLERDASSHDRFAMNDLILAIIVVIAMAVSLTDFTLSPGDFKNFTALTLFLYVVTTVIFSNRYNKGKQRGRSDAEFTESLKTYRTWRGRIIELGITSEVPAFCREYKVTELKEYRMSLLADVDIEYDEYMQKYRHMTDKDIMKLHLPTVVKKTLIKCNNAKPLRLTPGLIMNENGEADRLKLIGQSGREREIKDKRQNFITRAIFVLFGGMVAVNVILDFSVVTIIQWFVRMIPIFSAIIMGDDSGYCDITVTETNFKRDQTAVINLFLEYHNNKVGAEQIPEQAQESMTSEQ